MPDNFELFFQLSKVDEQSREVWGRATMESPDTVREIMDYDSSKPNFEKWSAAAFQRSGGKSYGNIREMHSNIAAGKAIKVIFNDDEKAIDIGTYCSEDSTWAKILDGTLTGFSIGGTAKRFPDRKNPSYIRYTAFPTEISYVDSPAHPDARFTLIKADGSNAEMLIGKPIVEASARIQEALPGVTVADDGSTMTPLSVETGEAVEPVPVVADHFVAPDLIDADRNTAPANAPRNEPVAKVALNDDAIAAIRLFHETVSKLAELQKATADQTAQQINNLRAIGSRVGIARRESEPFTPPNGFPSNPDDYGDPANYAWPVDTRNRTDTAVTSFNSGKGKPTYSDREWHILGRRVATKASALLGTRHQYDPITKLITSEGLTKMPIPQLPADLTKLDVGNLAAQVAQAVNVAADQIGNDPGAAKAMLMQLVGALSGAAASPTAAAVDAANPTPPTGSQGGYSDVTMKADSSTPSSPSSSTATTPSSTAPMTAATPPMPTPPSGPTMAMAVPPTPPSEASTATTPAPSYVTKADLDATMAKFAEQLNATLAAAIKGAAVAAEPAPVAKSVPAADPNAPIGNLAALLPVEQQTPPQDPVLKVLTSGDPNAYVKAAIAAGSEQTPNFVRVNQLIDQAWTESMGPVFTRMMLSKGLFFNNFTPSV